MTLPEFHLITHILCPYVQRSVIVLLEKGIPYQRTDIDLGNKPDWFARLSPLGKVPVLVAGQGNTQTLFESSVICEYLDEVTPGSLHPAPPLEKANHRAWIEFGSGILNGIGRLYNAKNRDAFEEAQQALKRQFEHLEQRLEATPFFCGDRFQLIDSVYGPIFRYFDVFEGFVDLEMFDGLPKTQSWRKHLHQRPSVRQAVSPDYPKQLLKFIEQRQSYMSTLVVSASTADISQ